MIAYLALAAASVVAVPGIFAIYYNQNQGFRRVPTGPVTLPTAIRVILTYGGVEVSKIMITDKQTAKVVAAPVDIVGNPATLPAGVTWSWSIDNTAIATIAVDPTDATGFSAIATPNPVAGNLGTCNINGASSDGLAAVTAPLQVVGSNAVSATVSITAVDPVVAAPAAPVTPAPATPSS